MSFISGIPLTSSIRRSASASRPLCKYAYTRKSMAWNWWPSPPMCMASLLRVVGVFSVYVFHGLGIGGRAGVVVEFSGITIEGGDCGDVVAFTLRPGFRFVRFRK